LSQAIAAFGGTLETANDLSVIKDSLKSVTGGLANAFETTLIALMAALIIQLLLTFLQQAELEFLDECNDYCHSHVVSKLRLVKNV
jgi:biopolymer transport protein ExbB/TolQ